MVSEVFDWGLLQSAGPNRTKMLPKWTIFAFAFISTTPLRTTQPIIQYFINKKYPIIRTIMKIIYFLNTSYPVLKIDNSIYLTRVRKTTRKTVNRNIVPVEIKIAQKSLSEKSDKTEFIKYAIILLPKSWSKFFLFSKKVHN